MRITDLDPIPYNLLFERFLNPERVSMPDFDIDFCMDRRDEVIEYVAEKYGKTSGRPDRDVPRAQGAERHQGRGARDGHARQRGAAASRASIPQPRCQGQMYTIPEALEVEPKLKALRQESDPTVARAPQAGEEARGPDAPRRHARRRRRDQRGAALGSRAVLQERQGKIVTQYDKDDVEQAGLVKFDFLGLKTLTVHRHRGAPHQRAARSQGQDAVRPRQRSRSTTSAPTSCFRRGETTGVFQLESSGMQQLFKDYQPDGFEDIVAPARSTARARSAPAW